MAPSQLTDRPSQSVLWAQVWGLATVQGAISLMWVIYNLYLVDLLGEFGFPRSLATVLLIIENLLAMVMEPLMGSLSDRVQQWVGSRFPLVSLGVILAAGIFVCLPIIAFSGVAALRSLLPLMLVAWALAMTVFRSPAMSLLSRYAFGTKLPQAASILTLVGGVAGSMGPLASTIILGWGPLVAFTLGSGVLLFAAIVLRLAQPDQTLVTEASSPDVSPDILPDTNLGAADNPDTAKPEAESLAEHGDRNGTHQLGLTNHASVNRNGNPAAFPEADVPPANPIAPAPIPVLAQLRSWRGLALSMIPS